MADVLVRLLANAEYVAESGCLVWTGYCNVSGYGKMSVQGVPRLTHRLAYTIHRGPIPDGMLVCHHCDVPCCINPEHLFLGTIHDNIGDASRKGRLTKTPETCAKIGLANRGRTRTPDAIEASASAHRGKVVSLTTREKLSAAWTDQPRFHGKTHSLATKAKMSASHLTRNANKKGQITHGS